MLNQVFAKREVTRGEQLLKAIKQEQQTRDQLSTVDAIQVLNNVKLNSVVLALNTLDYSQLTVRQV